MLTLKYFIANLTITSIYHLDTNSVVSLVTLGFIEIEKPRKTKNKCVYVWLDFRLFSVVSAYIDAVITLIPRIYESD